MRMMVSDINSLSNVAKCVDVLLYYEDNIKTTRINILRCMDQLLPPIPEYKEHNDIVFDQLKLLLIDLDNITELYSYQATKMIQGVSKDYYNKTVAIQLKSLYNMVPLEVK